MSQSEIPGLAATQSRDVGIGKTTGIPRSRDWKPYP